eukprot:NODE_8029_length_1529_cov_3.349501.p1 GENE.NODE_8029_length_1529_cov_3.349501~~NODE_8029_length_1529_cov_3.349501.p1  ORF type:complete len:388 (+),score=47.65 NODE_8029_length_1529_cov_3.349501:288-1451(+)
MSRFSRRVTCRASREERQAIVTNRSGDVVDIPLRIIKPHYWHTVVGLCDALGVPLIDTAFSVALFGDSDDFLSSGGGVVSGLIRNSRWYFGLFATSLCLAIWNCRPGETVGDLRRRLGWLDGDFYKQGVRRQLSWILSCPYAMVDEYPMDVVRDFMRCIIPNILSRSSPTRRVFPSLKSFEDALLAGKRMRTGHPIPAFSNERCIDGEVFNVVIIATEAPSVHKLIPHEWASIFDEFKYHPSHVFVHRDAALMPDNRAKWKALSVRDDSKNEAGEITVWVNEYYQGLDLRGDIFESVNPCPRPKDDLIVRECHMQRVVHTVNSANLQAQIAELQGREGYYFCGAYSVRGMGLLEQACCSAYEAVAAVHRDMAKKPSAELESRRSDLD